MYNPTPILIGKMLGRTFGNKAGTKFKFLKELYPYVWNTFGTKGIVKSYTITNAGRIDLLLDSRDYIITPYILANHIWEPNETRAVEILVKNGMFCLDIGAHIGYYSTIMSRLVGPLGSVTAFEPCNDTENILWENIHINNKHNTKVYPYAVSSSNLEELKIRRDNKTLASSNLYKGTVVNTCKTVALDLLMPTRIYPVNFIKMDIEGSEPKAIRGMQKILTEDKPILMTEIAPDALKAADEDPIEYILDLSKYFSYFYLPTKKGLQRIGPMESLHLAEQVGMLNVVCSSKELNNE